MKVFNSVFSKYFLIISIALLFDFFFNEITKSTFLNLIENILLGLVFISIHHFIDQKVLNKTIFIPLFLLFCLIIFIETVYYYLFQTTFNSSTVFVILDSNPSESIEFIDFYIDTPIIVFGVLILLIIIHTYFNLKQVVFSKFKVNKIKVLGLILVVFAFLKLSELIIYNLPYMAVRAGFEYYKESKKLGEYANDKYGGFENVHRKWSTNEQEIYIIIIGEATSRLHFGLYNYYRNTTPLLGEIKDELLIYNDVISPETYTIASLTKALTLGNYENPNAKFDGSIIQLLNQANFKTYWLSVQKPAGANDSQITNIGLGADKSYFLNIKRAQEKTIYDGVLVEKLKKLLSEKGNKKVIFLHTLGTHFNYENRYPDDFKIFNNQIPRSKFNKDYIYEQINAYDNAIRYADYVIRSVIETVRKHNSNSFVLYFSDHGEEVYDEIEFSGHFRNENLTKNIYEIPMVLWCSEKYQNKREVSTNLDFKFMIDDIFHGIADLTGVNANRVDSTRSIFNKNFKDRRRIIRDTINYDTFYE